MSEKLMIKTYITDTKAVEDKGRRVLNVTITTNTIDRDGDIIEPKGINLTNFRKNPVVLMAHDYRGLPIARAENIKKTDNGIISDVVFPEEGVYPLADTVYRLYKDKFMSAWSIGFIPIKMEDIPDDNEKDTEPLRRKGRRIKTSELLEYSGCAVPSNPEALTNMISKGIDIEPLKEAGFIEIEEPGYLMDKKGRELLMELVDDELKEKEIILKPEETEDYIHIPVRECEITATIDISKDEGIKALYCGKVKKIATYLFLKSKGWDMAKAKKWVAEHGKSEDVVIVDDLEELNLDLPIPNIKVGFDIDSLIKRIYEITEENKDLKEANETLLTKYVNLELKAGAVLNAKNKSNLKQAQELIQSVLDSAGITEENSVIIDDEIKYKEGDDGLVDIVTDTVDNPVINEETNEAVEEEIFKAKIETIINQSMKDNRRYFNNRLDYAIGRVPKK